MTKTPHQPTGITYDDAVEAIAVAITLGHPAPCFPQATYYQAHVWTWNYEENRAEDEVLLGTFVSREGAEIALRNYAMDAWNDWGEYPLLPGLEELEEPDHSGFTDEEIIEAFYTGSWHYSIDTFRMSRTPQRY